MLLRNARRAGQLRRGQLRSVRPHLGLLRRGQLCNVLLRNAPLRLGQLHRGRLCNVLLRRGRPRPQPLSATWRSTCDHQQRPNQPGRQQGADKPQRHPQHIPNRNVQYEAELDRQSQRRARDVELTLGRRCIAQSDCITQSEYPRPHCGERGDGGMA